MELIPGISEHIRSILGDVASLQSWLRDFVDGGGAREAVRRSIDDPDSPSAPGGQYRYDRLLVASDADWALDVVHVSARNPDELVSTMPVDVLVSARRSVVGVVRGGPALMVSRTVEDASSWSEVSGDSRLGPPSSESCDRFEVDMDRTTILEVVGDEPFYIATVRSGASPLLVHRFSRSDGRHVGTSFGRHSDMMTRNLCAYYRALGDRSALPQLREIAGHPLHVIRWAAIQAAASIDAGVGYDLLEKATGDPHHSIAGMARRALAVRI